MSCDDDVQRGIEANDKLFASIPRGGGIPDNFDVVALIHEEREKRERHLMDVILRGMNHE